MELVESQPVRQTFNEIKFILRNSLGSCKVGDGRPVSQLNPGELVFPLALKLVSVSLVATQMK